MGILETRNLGIEFNGKKILDDVNIDLWEGHVHAIVGPNGAGKSTLAYTIMGLGGYRNISGDILFQGESIKDLRIDERARRGMTLGWQEPARYEGLSIEKFVTAAVEDKSHKKIREVLGKAGLNPNLYLKRAVDRTLSGGERKKIELASILALKPKLVMLDEPDSGIDVASLRNIFDAIKLLKENGSTVVLITHSLEVLNQAEHAFLMCCGKIVEQGKIEKIRKYFEKKCIPCTHENIPDLNGGA
ncbi:MAG: ABC transporter ATP-binding protein [Candidatus Altiarchaeota archaeon]|nr:ABC transporter ATP-binding protein [Candidatus Altiarchaeota archaeon]